MARMWRWKCFQWMLALWRGLHPPSKPFATAACEGLSLIVRGPSGHRCALLAKARLCSGEGYVPEFHVRIPPDAQLTPLWVDRDE